MLAAALAALAPPSRRPRGVATTYPSNRRLSKMMERLPLRRERAQANGVTFTWGTVAASTARQHDAYAWAAALGRGLRVRRNSSVVSDTGTTFSLLAKPGYLLADLGVAPAGFYGSLGPARA